MEPNMAVIKLCVSSLWEENRSRLELLLEGTPAFRSIISVPTAPSDHVRTLTRPAGTLQHDRRGHRRRRP
jgi:hypothetical protein